MSQIDRAFLEKKIDSSEFLPEIKGPERREALKKALYALQGPFLTFRTLGEDLKVLQRVQGRLAGLLSHRDQKQTKKQTVRQYLTDYFGERFQELYTLNTDVDCWTSSGQFVTRCYEMVFLHMLRTVEFKTEISEADLLSLAQRVFLGQPDRTTDIIKTARPAPVDVQEGKDDIAIDKRHGMALFHHPEASRLLYIDDLQQPHITGHHVRPAHLSRDIACIFMYGKVLGQSKAIVHLESTCNLVRASESQMEICSTPIEQSSCTPRLQESVSDDIVSPCTIEVLVGRKQAFSGRAMPVQRVSLPLKSPLSAHKNVDIAETDVTESVSGYYGTSNFGHRATAHTEKESSTYGCSDLKNLPIFNSSRRPHIENGFTTQSLKAIDSEMRTLAESYCSRTLSMSSAKTCVTPSVLDAPDHAILSSINRNGKSRLPEPVRTPSSIYSSTLYEEPRNIPSVKIPLNPALNRFSKDYQALVITPSDLDSPNGKNSRKPGKSENYPKDPVTDEVTSKLNSSEPGPLDNPRHSVSLSTAANGEGEDMYVTFIATERGSDKKTVVVKCTDHYIKTFYNSQRLLDNDKEFTRFWHWKRVPENESYGRVEYQDLDQLMDGIKTNRPEVVYIKSNEIGSVDTARFGAFQLSYS